MQLLEAHRVYRLSPYQAWNNEQDQSIAFDCKLVLRADWSWLRKRKKKRAMRGVEGRPVRDHGVAQL